MYIIVVVVVLRAAMFEWFRVDHDNLDESEPSCRLVMGWEMYSRSQHDKFHYDALCDQAPNSIFTTTQYYSSSMQFAYRYRFALKK